MTSYEQLYEQMKEHHDEMMEWKDGKIEELEKKLEEKEKEVDKWFYEYVIYWREKYQKLEEKMNGISI